MKKIIILFVFISSVVTAQNNEFKYSLAGITKVVLSSDTKMNVEVGNTNELIISDTKNKKSDHHEEYEEHNELHEKLEKKEDKRKGLTAIYPGGKDNTNGFGFKISKEGTILYVTDLKSYMQRRGLTFKLPKNMNISVDAGNMGAISIEGFTGEVEADTNIGKIEMKNVTGPITASTSVGKIDIDFDTVSQKSPITITSSVSEIDVALPANTKANLELRTQGTVYTNFDFDVPEKKGMPIVNGRKSIVSKLNDGGVKIYIKSSLGNIYLRKK